MSRYCGNHKSEPILRAAAEWREKALVGTGSVFSGGQLWDIPTISSLCRHFVDAEDGGEGGFLDKLKFQLSDAEPQVKRLASEMLWLLLLCPSNVSVETKRDHIRTVWSWSGAELPETSALATPVLDGIGSGGAGFNAFRWKELAFLIDVMLVFRGADDQLRQVLMTDASRLSVWLAELPEGDARQFRHMLLYLLFPDHFERIFSLAEKRAVVAAFRELSDPEVQALSVTKVDEELLGIRREQEEKYKTAELDFYTPPLVTQWREDSSFEAFTKNIEK